MNAVRRGAMRSLLGITLLAAGGCAGISVADVLAASTGLPGMGSRLSGEVRRVDHRRQTIQLSGWQGGGEELRYDARTRVSYGRRSYRVSALERGDEVSVSVQRGRHGDLYARHIVVERSVRERGSDRHRDRRGDWEDGAEVRLLEGRVEQVDHRAGWLELAPHRGRRIMVVVPARAGKKEIREFRRLRRGNYVRLEAELLGRERAELVRFR